MMFEPRQTMINVYKATAAMHRLEGRNAMAGAYERAAIQIGAKPREFNAFDADAGVTGPNSGQKYGLCQRCGKDVVLEACTGYHCPFDGAPLTRDFEDGIGDCPSCGAKCKR